MAKSTALSTDNPKILDFFSNHKSLDFEETILSFISIINKLEDQINNNLSNDNVQHILSEIKSNNQNILSEINFLNQNVKSIESGISQQSFTFLQQLSDFKKQFIDDLRLNLSSNVSDKYEPILKEQLNLFYQKTESLIPKQNSDIQDNFQQTIQTLNHDAEKFLNSTINESTLNNFLNQVDIKFSSALSNSQQHIIQNISQQEQRLDNKISDIQEKTNAQSNQNETLNTSVTEVLKKLENSSAKGQMSENIMVNILHSLFPTSQIDHVGQTKETGDIILSRKNKPKILIENKNWGKNVVQEEVKKFIHDIETQNCCGLFLSQNYGVANKENFEINIHDGNVLIYVHEVNNDPEKIKTAISIIDNFKERLDDFNIDNNMDSIPKEILDSINFELNSFTQKKNEIIKKCKLREKELLKDLNDLQLLSLQKYLSSRYATSSSKFVCEYCGFIAKNNAAKSAHLRGCQIKKNNSSSNQISISTNNL